MKKTLILSLIFVLLTTTCVAAKKVSKPTVKLTTNEFTSDWEYRRIRVDWKKIKNKTSYQIQRSKYKNFKTVDSDITLLNLKNDKDCNHGYYTKNFNTDFYVRVRAKGGKWSNVVKAEGIRLTPIPCLVKNERTNNKCTIRIEWDSVKNANYYEVQRSIYSDFRKHDDTVTKSTKNTYYQCTASNSNYSPLYGPANQTYYLRVRAVNKNGKVSDWSGYVTARGQYSME